ncbi:MAG: hypothetical protein PF517_10030 [Salinivirgaceae bacterium]|jgi:hypothetical protein|nr:hypothetical protein [Salinivirgaceae bacterium]
MKVYAITIFIIVFFLPLSKGQNVQNETSKSGNISTSYNRNAITTILIDNGNKYMGDLKQGANGIVIPDKYDNNLLNTRYIATRDNELAIKQALINKSVPNEIIAKWFARDQETGRLNMSVVHKRGMYNATDDDVLRASGSKIGLAKLKDAGEQLINSSYILALNISDIETMEERYKRKDELNKVLSEKFNTEYNPAKRRKNGWVGKIKGYLYQLNFSDSIMNLIYNDLWIYDDDDEATIAIKREKFQQVKFPLTFIIDVDGDADGSQYNEGEILAPAKQLTKVELYSKMINTGMETVFFGIERKVDEFQVKTPLYGTKPLKSKIGKKEGVKTDQRYFVYEFKQKRSGELKAIRKGVIRAKSVVDNRQVASGNSQLYTQFYQTSGFGLMEGQLIQQKNDYGIGVSAGSNLLGEMGGSYLKIEANLSVVSAWSMGMDLGATQFKLYLSAAMQTKEYTFSDTFGNGTYDMEFTRLNVGFSKGWYIANNFSIAPFLGYSMETATNKDWIGDTYDEDDDQNIGTDIVHWGAYATINILHNLQIMGTFNMYSIIGAAYNKDREELDGSKYNDIFKNRSGMSIDLGIRLEF